MGGGWSSELVVVCPVLRPGDPVLVLLEGRVAGCYGSAQRVRLSMSKVAFASGVLMPMTCFHF